MSFLKWINLMRTGNMNLRHDSVTIIVRQIEYFKYMITQDNIAAARTLEALGATKQVCRIVTPNTANNAAFSDISCLGDRDGLTLGHKEAQLSKPFFNVHKAIAKYNKPEMDNKVLFVICCIILQALSIVIWEEY